MLNDLANWLFNPAGLTPHGFCLLWQPWLIWTHAISDLTVGLAYFSIPLGLGVIFRKRPDLIYRQMLGLFASFILLCGLTHWLDLLTLYVPYYGLQAVVKALTALVSILTAIALWRLLPKALRLPSHAQLQELNDDLRRSREFLNRIGEIAGVGGWELDIATSRLTWSAETYRIHGLAENFQPTLADGTSFFAPDARPVIAEAVNLAISEGKAWDLELPFIRANGEQIWVRALGALVTVENKAVRLVGALQDITHQVSARLMLQRLNERFDLATKSGGIGIWDWDITRDALSWDGRMFALYGLQARDEALTVELWQSMLHPEDRRNNELTLQKALAHRDDYDNVFRIIWGDGSIHHIRAAGKVSRNEQGAPVRMTGTSIDITESERLKAEIAEQHELLTVTLASIGDGVITTDADGDVTWMNPVAEQMTGWSVSESVGQQIDQVFNIVDEETRTRAENPLHACMSGSRTVGLANNTVLTSRIGIEYGIADSAAPIHNSKNELLGMVLVFHDVTEQRRLTGEMSYRASHDALTGLINRIEFDSRLRRMLKKAQADGTSGALLYIDLDQFKIVNDTCGHAVGDQLLQQVAKLLCGVIRTTDTLARLGGDEFAVLLEDCTNVQAGRLAQRICESIGNFRFIHDGQRFRIGASIGLVHVDDRWNSVSAIQQAADSSCYAAKESGRNRVHLWYDTDESILSRKTQMKWTTRLESALDENRFVLFFQRIEPLNGRPTGVHAEILLRMVDSDGSLVSPGAFMPAAERFHLASRIDRLVLRKAINWMTQTPALGAIDTLSINFSGQSVGDRSFHQWALNELETAGLDICRKLCIEITETAAVTNFADASTFIEQVHLRGVRVALDDFGAGAASFGYLKTLSVDIIKIDGQFIRNLATDPLDAAAVRCFVDVARVMGLKTVAEFVEDPTVRDLLRDMNVDFGQGFLLHRPESLDLFVDSG